MYNQTLNEKLSRGYHVREPLLWSECVAVGDRDWITGHARRLAGINKEIVSYVPPRKLGEDQKSYDLRESEKNKLSQVVLRLALDSIAPIEQNHKNSLSILRAERSETGS